METVRRECNDMETNRSSKVLLRKDTQLSKYFASASFPSNIDGRVSALESSKCNVRAPMNRRHVV